MRPLFRFLSSLKLAVILLLSLAAILGTATYYEAKYDAKTASHLVYGSPWFYFFLFMLGVNVTCAAAVRYPWKKRQTGFVITHLGIITILLGSFVTIMTGFEGSLALSDGETGRYVTVDKPTLSYQVIDGKRGHNAVDEAGMVSIPVELRWSPPTEDRPRRYKLSNGLVVLIDRYLHHALPVTEYRDGGPAANPAVEFRLANGRINAQEWLALADPERQQVQLGPASVRILRASTADELQRALAKSDETAKAKDGMLVFEIGGRHPVVPVDGNVGSIVAVEGTPYRVKIERYLPYAVVEHDKLVNRSNERVNPAVEFVVLDSQGEAERHLAFARFPEFSTTHHKARPTKLKVIYTFDDPQKTANGIDLVVGPSQELYYKIRSSVGEVKTGPIKIGEDVATGWKMGLVLTVLQYLPRARTHREYRDFRPARGKEGPPPAIRLRVEGADDPGPYWLQQGDDVVVGRGRQATRIFYHLQGLALGFDLKLKHFEVGYDPGTRNAASYASDVVVQDASHQRNFDYHISMNDPLHYNGMTFFQASFEEASEGKATVSILQVARDPGVPVKYAGCILLVCGIAIMFFWKPSSGKRKAEPKSEKGSPP